MKRRVTIAVIGKGKLGTAMAKSLSKSKHYRLHSHLAARSRSFKILSKNGGPDVLFIITKDNEIRSTAIKAASDCGNNLRYIAHTAGSMAPNILPRVKNVTRITLHPIQTISKPDENLLNGISWMICAESTKGISFGREFCRYLHADKILQLKPSQLALYHTLTVFASNFTTLLGGAVEMMSKRLMIDDRVIKKALSPLMRQSLENVLTGEAAKVLTGPIARKDYATILKHRIALRKMPPAFRKIYEGFVMLGSDITKTK
jgi:predicted short-subunit dehydrogenase-like oxidoreductase (DUF2520 family)